MILSQARFSRPRPTKMIMLTAFSCALAACSSSETGTVLNTNVNSIINVAITGSGTVTSSPAGINCPSVCNFDFEEQNRVVLTAVPDSGWVLSHWQGACRSNVSTCTINISNTSNNTATAVFRRLNNDISVDDFSLINADTDQAINGFNPIADNSQINLNQLNGIALNLRANTTGNVQSVQFGLGDRANYRIENSQPFALNNEVNGNYSDWGLALGQQRISAAAFSQSNAQGDTSPLKTLNINLVAVRWQLLNSPLNFTGVINSLAPGAKDIQIRNTGNISGTLSLQSSLPSWLNLSTTSVDISANQIATISASISACQSLGTQNTTLVFGGENAATISLDVQRVCTNTPDNDFALNRFYINQSVPAQDSIQSKNQQTPLVANRAGLARAFVTATNANNQSPEVVLYYRYNNGPVSSIVLNGPDAVPLNTSEASLNTTFNRDLASNVIQAGMQIYIEVDPNNDILESNENNNRYPASGYLTVEVDQVPSLNIVVVPIRVNNGSVPSFSQSRLEALFRTTQKLHPVAQINVSQRSAISYNGRSWEDMLEQLRDVYNNDFNTRGKLYHGIIEDSPDNSNTAGIGYLGNPVAISLPLQGTIAHEVGHNFDLPHAPCGGPSDADINYPYPNADIGIYGYDIIDKGLRAPNRKDVMSYCEPIWISDYNYKKVLSFRQSSRGYAQRPTQTSAFATADSNLVQSVLSVSGKINNETATFNRVMQLQGHARTTKPGPYRLVAFDTTDAELFSLAFDSIKIDHSTSQHFSLNIPLEALNGEQIARLAIYRGEQMLAQQVDTSRPANALFAKQQSLGLKWQAGELVFSWDQQTYQSVMLRNHRGEVIAFDNTGKLNLLPSQLGIELSEFDTLESKEKTLELVYSRGLSSKTTSLEIPAP